MSKLMETPEVNHHGSRGETKDYMLRRDTIESERLEYQHGLFKELFGGHILHPHIPTREVRNVADVATGTGVWLRNCAKMLKAQNGAQEGSFVGFDLSNAQFVQDPSVEYVVQDATQPFPERFLEFFDVVHIRLLSFGIQAAKLEDLVRNVTSILKPGGYLIWTELDMIDTILTPQPEAARRRLFLIMEERIARGLTPAIITPLVRIITNLRSDDSIADPKSLEISCSANPEDAEGSFNTLTWDNKDLLRLIDLSTASTATHPSPVVQQRKENMADGTYRAFLELGAARRRKLASESTTSEEQKASLLEQADELESLVTHPDLVNVVRDVEVVRLLAKKAKMSPMKGPWQTAKCGVF